MSEPIELLIEARRRFPELRLGQLIWNALALAGYWKAPEGNGFFNITDDKLDDALNTFLKRHGVTA